MSEGNVEVIRRGLDALNRRDKDLWNRVCDPEVENFPPREWPESAPARGIDATWEFFVEAVDTWDSAEYAWGEVIVVGRDRLVAHQLSELRGRASGAEVAWDYWVVFTFRDERVLRFEWFADRADALEAAGL
jgi:ketosteroid isomerase-like protein